MSWDVLTVLDRHGIHYVREGANVARGNVNINCPFCGRDDPSEHLGINLETGYWGCWRNAEHRGKSPIRLVQALLRTSYAEAARIVGYSRFADLSDFQAAAERLRSGKLSTESATKLKLPSSFRPLKDASGSSAYSKYMVHRGFREKDVRILCDTYNLRYCITGGWRGRVILPLYLGNELVTWVGRSIKNHTVRYMALSKDVEKSRARGDPVAVCSIKETIFNFDALVEDKGRRLYVCEGPLDALKVDFYGQMEGVRATCLFSNSINEEQKYLLSEVVKNYRELIVMLDQNTVSQTMQVMRELSIFNAIQGKLPAGVKDPGDLSPRQVTML